jgi:hypothetical protein
MELSNVLHHDLRAIQYFVGFAVDSRFFETQQMQKLTTVVQQQGQMIVYPK